MRFVGVAGVALMMAAVAGCFAPTVEESVALAKATTTGVEEGDYGSATFRERRGQLVITVAVRNVGPGDHGVHIHEKGDCGPGAASATNATVVAAGAAGGHFNPRGAAHPNHAGDLGNIPVGQTGQGQRIFSELQAPITLGDGFFTIRNRTIVVHERGDDLATEPSGNSGPRMLCAVIPIEAA